MKKEVKKEVKKEIKIIEIINNKIVINKKALQNEQILKDLYVFNNQ